VKGRVDELAACIESKNTWAVLTGAGCSTAAGLGDYRNRRGEWKRPQPITGQLFRTDTVARQRYWARSSVGWPHFARAEATDSHHALVQLQHSNRAPHLITQNVDELHQQAGHQHVIDLHGVLGQVVCLTCHAHSTRHDMQNRLLQDNPWLNDLDASHAPDGDADLEIDAVHAVKVPACLECGGLLKPDVVFFGENVPRGRVAQAFNAIDEASGLLVVGSSLMVYSGYRFCVHASRTQKPIVIINDGVTRADDIAEKKFTGDCGRLLLELNRWLADH